MDRDQRFSVPRANVARRGARPSPDSSTWWRANLRAAVGRTAAPKTDDRNAAPIQQPKSRASLPRPSGSDCLTSLMAVSEPPPSILLGLAGLFIALVLWRHPVAGRLVLIKSGFSLRSTGRAVRYAC